MNTERKYLVCLDGSPRADTVLQTAIDLALRTKARLTLFRSVGLPAEVSQEEYIDILPASIPEAMLAAATRGLMRYRETMPAEVLDAVEVKLGTPWESICQEAKKIGADMIIMGSHGYGTLDRILGTTAAKVVNHAHCSVLVVR